MGLSTGDFTRFEMPIWNEIEAITKDAVGAGKFSIPADRRVRSMHERIQAYMALLSRENEANPKVWNPPSSTLAMPGQERKQQAEQELDYSECLTADGLTPEVIRARLAYGSASQEQIDADMLNDTTLRKTARHSRKPPRGFKKSAKKSSTCVARRCKSTMHRESKSTSSSTAHSRPVHWLAKICLGSFAHVQRVCSLNPLRLSHSQLQLRHRSCLHNNNNSSHRSRSHNHLCRRVHPSCRASSRNRIHSCHRLCFLLRHRQLPGPYQSSIYQEGCHQRLYSLVRPLCSIRKFHLCPCPRPCLCLCPHLWYPWHPWHL
jgi:hypothetical protein